MIHSKVRKASEIKFTSEAFQLFCINNSQLLNLK